MLHALRASPDKGAARAACLSSDPSAKCIEEDVATLLRVPVGEEEEG